MTSKTSKTAAKTAAYIAYMDAWAAFEQAKNDAASYDYDTIETMEAVTDAMATYLVAYAEYRSFCRF